MFRCRSLFLLSLNLFLGLSGPMPVWAQRAETPASPVSLRVRVVFDRNDRPVSERLRVQLLHPSGGAIAEKMTDDLGYAEFVFFANFPYNYRLKVSGNQIVETTTDVFAISPRESAHTEFVRVQSVASSGEQNTELRSDLVTAGTLAVPAKARKEYAIGGKALQEGRWQEARMRLEKAIELYPRYALAYNDLGVVYMNTGEREKGREAFEKAISSDERFARAYRNLAYLEIAERKYAKATSLLEKGLVSDPLNAETLALLAQVHLLNGRIEEALACANKVHGVPHEGQAVAHYIAALALESRNLHAQAVDEYRMFLKEAPNSASAPKVRAALEKLAAKVN